MFISLKMMQSTDGIISRNADDMLDWGSSEDKKIYKQVTKKYGTVILGSTTFESMPKIAFKDRKAVILTRSPEKYKEFVEDQGNLKVLNDFTFLPPNPNLVVSFLESKGINEAIVAGGGKINHLFLKNNLVNKIYLTITPRIFGNGTRVFGDDILDCQLTIEDIQKITPNEILITYLVQKNDI